MIGLLAFAFAGVLFVLVSQNGGFQTFFDLSEEYSAGIYLGFLLGLLAAFITAFTGFSWVWASKVSVDERIPQDARQFEQRSLETFFLLVALMLNNVAAALINGAIGLTIGGITGEWITLSGMSYAIIGGMFSYGVASVMWRFATSHTSNVGIHAISYLTPIFSLVALAIASQIGEISWPHLSIGVITIIISNVLINFEAEIRWGFKALLLALGTCGAVVYLRDGAFLFIGLEQWNWRGDGYFESITLAATVFILLLAFRVARLISHTSDEDNRTFIVYRKFDLLARRGVIDGQVCRHLLEIDRARNNSAAEQGAYIRARRVIEQVDPTNLDEADAQPLSDAESQLDALARSKQIDIHLG